MLLPSCRSWKAHRGGGQRGGRQWARGTRWPRVVALGEERGESRAKPPRSCPEFGVFKALGGRNQPRSQGRGYKAVLAALLIATTPDRPFSRLCESAEESLKSQQFKSETQPRFRRAASAGQEAAGPGALGAMGTPGPAILPTPRGARLCPPGGSAVLPPAVPSPLLPPFPISALKAEMSTLS